MTFPGANAAPTITGSEKMPVRANYLIGSDSSQWHTGVPTYSSIQPTSARQLHPIQQIGSSFRAGFFRRFSEQKTL
jgi:hypothetical protein